MRKILLLGTLLMFTIMGFSSEGYIFRIYLKDKGKTSFSVGHPQEFLSQRALDRRLRQHISVDESDLPISEKYIQAIDNVGFTIVAKSKWMRTISAFTKDSLSAEKLKKLNFVDSVKFVWKKDMAEVWKRNPVLKRFKNLVKPQHNYGYGFDQMNTLNAFELHERGYKGDGMEIAVIDAGYTDLSENLLLENTHIKGMKDFVYKGGNMLKSSDHGLKVFSVMASNRSGTYIGTAPEASYWLLRSEEGISEYPVEEDYWTAAAEYADSVGVDIINTSLGYSRFDAPAHSYEYEQLDGKTAFLSRAAEVAASKGIFVEISAGNEGNNTWGKIVVPSDAEHVLAVGAISKDSIIAPFSSRGPSADSRVKPDVVALGRIIHVIGIDGTIEQTNGTSFAGPVMSGLVACLWQAYPELTNLDLLNIIRKSAHKYRNPDSAFGYGIPDMKKAYVMAQRLTSGIKDEIVESDEPVEIVAADSLGSFRVNSQINENSLYVYVFSLQGKLLLQEKLMEQSQIFSLPNVTNQIIIVNVRGKNISISKKIKCN